MTCTATSYVRVVHGFQGVMLLRLKHRAVEQDRKHLPPPLPRPTSPLSPVARAELAYGDGGRSALITPGSVLVFELELIEVQGPAAQATAEL